MNVKGVVIQKVTGFHAGQVRRQRYNNVCVRYNDEWCNDLCTPYGDGFSLSDNSDFIIFKMAKNNVKTISYLQAPIIQLDDLQIFYTGKS